MYVMFVLCLWKYMHATACMQLYTPPQYDHFFYSVSFRSYIYI
jgi:hypothetical protein